MSDKTEVWKDANPKMICPVCLELNIRSCLFVTKCATHLTPGIRFYDENGNYHEHFDVFISYYECSNNHVIKRVSSEPKCFACEEDEKGIVISYESNLKYTLEAVTDLTIISKLRQETYEDGPRKILIS